MKKDITFILLYVLLSLFSIYLITLLYFYFQIPPTYINKNTPSISPLVSSLIGKDQPIDKKSCFINYNVKKKKGIVRIGCFGDSFTYGEEVDIDKDYPSLLQKIFSENGNRNYEVLNFGNDWLGFHQSYIMWDFLGKKYNLDYIIFGPSFPPRRDLTLNHAGKDSPGYIHARYIVTKNNVCLINPINKTNYKKRFMSYYKLIPNSKYFKYDTILPSFFNLLIPNNHSIKNPFYYYKNNNELTISYSYLLQNIPKNIKVIFILYDENNIINFLKKTVKNKNITFYSIQKLDYFPYIANCSHNSPQGNLVLAKFLFNIIKNNNNLNILKFNNYPYKNLKPTNNKINNLSLNKYDKIYFEINKIQFGYFISKQDIYNKDFNDLSYNLDLFKKNKIKSLLLLRTKNNNYLDSIYLPLNFELKNNLPVHIKTPSNTLELGKVSLLSENLPIGELIIDGIINNNNNSLFFKNLNWPAEGSLTINNKKLFKYKIKNKCLNIEQFNYFRIKPTGTILINTETLAKKGIIFIVCEKNNIKIKKPYCIWEKYSTNNNFLIKNN